MNVAEVITLDRVTTAARVHSRKRALQRLSELLAEGAPYLTASEIFSALVAREKLGSTGIGHGVAIPHARMKGIDESIAALLRLPNGIDFETDDGQPVDIILGLLVPEESTHAHSDILQTLAQALHNADCRADLRRASDDAALLGILARCNAATSPSPD